ncbi:MAG: type II toxin-antitoxin system VapB family antitoxin [Pseudonocardiaceae bacterium]
MWARLSRGSSSRSWAPLSPRCGAGSAPHAIICHNVAYRIAIKVAALAGETKTAAVRVALRERLGRLRASATARRRARRPASCSRPGLGRLVFSGQLINCYLMLRTAGSGTRRRPLAGSGIRVPSGDVESCSGIRFDFHGGVERFGQGVVEAHSGGADQSPDVRAAGRGREGRAGM